MTDAHKKGNSIQVEIIPCAIMPYYLIELQINLETGTFRRKEIQSTADNEKVLTLKTAWRAKKGHHHLLFMAGNNFLHGLSLEQ